MPPLDTESQFKFLIACIKHSANGKVDFEKVASECEIVSKGAAAKRYERLMKAHGISSTASARGTPTKRGKSKEPSTPRSAKKRKLETVDDNAGDVDEPAVKGELKTEDAIHVKTEQGNSVIASLPDASSQTETPANAANAPAADDDDDVIIVCETRNPDDNIGVPAYSNAGGSGSDDHHHSPAPMATAGVHSFDYGTCANTGFPTQTRMVAPMAPMTEKTPRHSQVFPYGFTTSQPLHGHDPPFFWHNVSVSHHSSHNEVPHE